MIMSHEVLVRKEERSPAPAETLPRELLDRVVESVRRDSEQAAAEFLAETVVPHGGE
jgi:hypothetical protein